MTRLLRFSLVLGLAGAWAGCGNATTLDEDAAIAADTGPAAVDSGTPMVDGGLDAFVTTTDANVPHDDGGRDGGHDTGPDSPLDAGSVLTPIDAGNPFTDGGAGLGEPAWVPLTVHIDGTHCAAFTPCGGEIVGTWDVGGGCVEVDLTAIMRCPGAHASSSGQSRGRVVFDGTMAHRVAESEVDIQATLPAICATLAGGCMAIQTMIQGIAPDSACVTQTGGSCLCQIRQINHINDSDLYTTSGSEIIGTGSGKHWGYCVAGDSLEYQDASSTGMREPGIIDLTRRSP